MSSSDRLDCYHRLERERIQLLLLEDVKRGLADIAAAARKRPTLRQRASSDGERAATKKHSKRRGQYASPRRTCGPRLVVGLGGVEGLNTCRKSSRDVGLRWPQGFLQSSPQFPASSGIRAAPGLKCQREKRFLRVGECSGLSFLIEPAFLLRAVRFDLPRQPVADRSR
jgi:hypothetical protein